MGELQKVFMIVTSVVFVLVGIILMDSAHAKDSCYEMKVEKDKIRFCREVSKMSGKDAGNYAGSFDMPSRLLIVHKKGFVLPECEGLSEVVDDGDNMCVALFDSYDNAKKAAVKLKKNKVIESVEFDRKISHESQSVGIPDKMQKQEWYNPANTDQQHLSWGAGKIGVDRYIEFIQAEDHGAIKIAVVDTGVQADHPFLQARMLTGYDFIEDDEDVSDGDGHGTHVAGIIVDNTQGVDDVKILPVRVLDENGAGSLSDIANGIIYAYEKGANVINLSLGDLHSNYIENAVNKCSGAAVVAAAGNDGYSIERYYVCPAHMEEVITVGAIDPDGLRSEYSNYGKALDIMAPGTDIKSTVPVNSYDAYTGTSMAASHVSACVALLKLHYGGKIGNKKIEKLIARASDKKGSATYYGNGVLNMNRMFGKIMSSSVKLSYTECTCSNSKKKPSVTVKINGKVITKGSDYSLSYSNNKSVGTASVTVEGKGTYSGKAVKHFRIVPRQASVTIKTIKGRKIKLNMPKYPAAYEARSFQIYYKQKGASKWKVKRTMKKSVLIKALKKGKRYYVKVRAYKKVNGKTYYGKWSMLKTSSTIK